MRSCALLFILFVYFGERRFEFEHTTSRVSLISVRAVGSTLIVAHSRGCAMLLLKNVDSIIFERRFNCYELIHSNQAFRAKIKIP